MKNLFLLTALVSAGVYAQEVLHYDFVDEHGMLHGGTVQKTAVTEHLRRFALRPLDATQYPVTAIINHGDPTKHYNIVVMGDGFTAADMDTFHANVDKIITNFFASEVLGEYASYFNVYRIDVTSPESGVDNDPTQGIQKNTTLDMGFWCANIERLLCVNDDKAKAVAAQAPAHDLVLVVGNTNKYGGAGGGVATVSGGDGASVEIALHEFGHTFANLADEYDYDDPGPYTGPDPSEPDSSIFFGDSMARLQKKWFRWFGTPGVGLFEGASYHKTGVYRPTVNSKMRNLGQPFGPVNNEQFVIKLYQHARPILSSTPAQGRLARGAKLSVTPMKPATHDLSIQWFVDGVATGESTAEFDTTAANLTPGEHVVTARVLDATPYVRDPIAQTHALSAERDWIIE